ncbi:MAG: hypothetical protein WCF23_17915, partial [Candidatus Nitrosopolaris sp.]
MRKMKNHVVEYALGVITVSMNGYDFSYEVTRTRIQIITLVLGVSLLAAGFATTSAYGLVKITSPAKGQQVPIGNIMISGTSSSNTTN